MWSSNCTCCVIQSSEIAACPLETGHAKWLKQICERGQGLVQRLRAEDNIQGQFK